MLAMVVNDIAGIQDEPGALETIASKLAPTVLSGVILGRDAAWAQPILASSSATMATVWMICSSVCSHETKKRTRATCSGTAG